MKSIQNTKQEIPKVLFWINVIFIIIGIFKFNKGLFMGALITNLLFLGSYYIVGKFEHVLNALMFSSKIGGMAKKLNNIASI